MFEPYPYQVACLDAIEEARQLGRDRALAVMASGLGKTVTSASDAHRWLLAHPGKRLLFLCHQNYILEQARATFEAIMGDSFSYGMFTGEEKNFHGVSCLFASFQTMVIYKEYFTPDEFGYVVVDESHHSHAESWREVVRYFTPDFILGITATPNRLDEQNIREFFGPEVFLLPLEEALVRGYLTPVDYRLLADEISREKMIETPAGKLSIKYLNRTIFIPKRDEEIAEIIAKHCEDIDNPRIMIFCKSIAHCNHFAEFMPSCMAIHSRITPKERAVRLELFRAGIVKVVATVDCFNEGIDVPQANVIVFLRSTDSPTIFFQQLGRGLRLSDGKNKVLILDFAGNCERVEMVYKLWQKIKEKGQALGKVREFGDLKEPTDLPPNGPFMIDVNQVSFSQTIIEILDVVNRIRMGVTKENLIEQLRQEAERLGRSPKTRDLQEGMRVGRIAGITAFRSLFGSYNKALHAAGLEVNRHSDLSKEEMIELLERLAKELGRTPVKSDLIACSYCPTFKTYIRTFGSYTKALRMAGLQSHRKAPEENSMENLTASLKKLFNILQRTPQKGDIEAASKEGICPCFKTFTRAFGSYNKALEVAGLQSCRKVGEETSRENLVVFLKKLTEILGRTPLQKDIDNASKKGLCPSYKTFQRVFGTLSNALEEACCLESV